MPIQIHQPFARRRLLISLGAGALAAPFGLLAQQQPRIPRIGFLEPLARDSDHYRAFLRGLRELGYVEGKSIVIEARFADGNLERLPALAEELVKLKVDIIVTQSTPGVRAARQATTATPIVMIAIGDPVGSGFVKSLARPGGHITGLSNIASDISPKLLEMLKAAVPKLSRIAVLVNPANANHAITLKNIQAAAQQVSLKISHIEVRTPGDIESAFAAMAPQRPGAVIVLGDPFFRRQAPQIAGLALRYKLPSASTNRDMVEGGVLLSYGANIADSYWRAASYVDKILKGAKPAEIPVEQPTKIHLTINRKTAKALGLTIPEELLIRADEVIQ